VRDVRRWFHARGIQPCGADRVHLDHAQSETAKAGIDCTTQADIDAAGCHVGVIAASAYITPGTRDATRYTPYSTLAAIETMDGLPLLGRAQTATPLGPGMGF
jgi:hypothetical protein